MRREHPLLHYVSQISAGRVLGKNRSVSVEAHGDGVAKQIQLTQA